MKLKTGFIYATVISLLFEISLPTGVAFGQDQVGCKTDGRYQITDIANGLFVCNEAQVSVYIDQLGDYLEIPSKGVSQSMIFDSQAAGGLSEASITVAEDGLVTLSLDGQSYGSTRAGNVAAATTNSPSAVTAFPGCSTSSTKFYGYYWNSSWSWRYNSANQADTSALSAIQSAYNLWSTGVDRCTGVVYNSTFVNAYLGATSKTPAINSSGACGAADTFNTVGWGVLPTPTIALTCTWVYASIASESDMKFNSNLLFYTGSSTSGCSGSRYDLREIAAHEAGHVVGLDHSTQTDQQLLKPQFGYCETNQRLLAPGDVYGLMVLY